MKGRKALWWSFVAYCVLMAWLLFGRERYASPHGYWQQVADNLNPLLFETVSKFVRVLVYDYSDNLKRYAVVNLVGNVIMFVPFGFLTTTLWVRFHPLWRCLLQWGMIIACVELIQLFALVGSCDVDDLMLNVLGIGIGYGLGRWIQGRKNKG